MLALIASGLAGAVAGTMLAKGRSLSAADIVSSLDASTAMIALQADGMKPGTTVVVVTKDGTFVVGTVVRYDMPAGDDATVKDLTETKVITSFGKHGELALRPEQIFAAATLLPIADWVRANYP